MAIVGAALGVLVEIVFALVIAGFGIRALMKARRRGTLVQLLPWWYQGGQPDLPPGTESSHSDDR